MTNPDTCLHRVIKPGGNRHLYSCIHCISCDLDLTGSDLLEGKLYEYNSDKNVFVYVPKSRVK